MRKAVALLVPVLTAGAAHAGGIELTVEIPKLNVADNMKVHKEKTPEMLTFMMENTQNIGPSTSLLFVAKNLERIGDHATNIAEMVYFAATGDRLADSPERDSP